MTTKINLIAIVLVFLLLFAVKITPFKFQGSGEGVQFSLKGRSPCVTFLHYKQVYGFKDNTYALCFYPDGDPRITPFAFVWEDAFPRIQWGSK